MKNKETNILRFDWAIRHLLRQRINFGILAGFLSELLKEDIRIDEILENESNQRTADGTYNRIDIQGKNSKDELVIIEIQNDREFDYLERLYHNTYKTVSEIIPIGEKYHHVKKVYAVNILHFDFGKGSDYVFHAVTHFRGLHTGATLALSDEQQKVYQKRYPEEVFPEYYIIDVTQFDNVAKNTLDEWIYYLKNSTIQSNATAKGLTEAVQTLNELLMNPQERRTYERFISNRVIVDSQVETARMRGFRKGQIIGMIVAGFKKGASVEFLADISNLSLEEVQQIIDTESKKQQ